MISGFSDKYIGITLIFVFEDNQWKKVEKRDYLLRNNTKADIKCGIKRIVSRMERKFAGTHCKYIGIHDVFDVLSPLKEGALLGFSSYRTYKNLEKSKTLTRTSKYFAINKSQHESIDGFYLAEFVFFIGKPETYKNRRAVVINVLVQATDSSKIRSNVNKLCRSKDFLGRVEKYLLDRDTVESCITYIGLRNIKYLPERIKSNNCFAAVYREYQNIADVKKMTYRLQDLV